MNNTVIDYCKYYLKITKTITDLLNVMHMHYFWNVLGVHSRRKRNNNHSKIVDWLLGDEIVILFSMQMYENLKK